MQEKDLRIPTSQQSSIQHPSHLEKSYIVCSTGRSGSTLLCTILTELGFWGNPEEFFHRINVQELNFLQNPEGLIDYLNIVLQKGTTPNGVFGMKMHYWQFIDFIRIAKKLPDFKDKTEIEILNSIFPELQFIYIWRRDTIKQAISTVIALQSGIWVKSLSSGDKNGISQENESNADQEQENTEVNWKFKPLDIYCWQKSFEDQNRRWLNFFEKNSLSYYEVIYEEFVKAIDPTIRKLTEFLKLDRNLLPDTLPIPIKKQSNYINNKFLKKYKRIPLIFLKIAYKISTLKKKNQKRKKA